MGTDGLKEDSWRAKTCYPANCVYTRCWTYITYDEAWKTQGFLHLAEGSLRLQPEAMRTWLSRQVHPTEGTDTLTRHQPTPSSPLALPSPPHRTSNDLSTIEFPIAVLAGAATSPPTTNQLGVTSMGQDGKGKSSSRAKQTSSRVLPRWEGVVESNAAGKTWAGRRNGGLHSFRLLTVITLVSEM